MSLGNIQIPRHADGTQAIRACKQSLTDCTGNKYSLLARRRRVAIPKTEISTTFPISVFLLTFSFIFIFKFFADHQGSKLCNPQHQRPQRRAHSPLELEATESAARGSEAPEGHLWIVVEGRGSLPGASSRPSSGTRRQGVTFESQTCRLGSCLDVRLSAWNPSEATLKSE